MKKTRYLKTKCIYFKSSLLCIFLKDEDPALRELAEMEKESCVQDIQDLSKKVGVSNSVFGYKMLHFKVTRGKDLVYHSVKSNCFFRSWIC